MDFLPIPTVGVSPPGCLSGANDLLCPMVDPWTIRADPIKGRSSLIISVSRGGGDVTSRIVLGRSRREVTE